MAALEEDRGGEKKQFQDAENNKIGVINKIEGPPMFLVFMRI